jgi:hypothetical protein
MRSVRWCVPSYPIRTPLTTAPQTRIMEEKATLRNVRKGCGTSLRCQPTLRVRVLYPRNDRVARPRPLIDWERHQTVRYLDDDALAVQWRGYSCCRMCELTTNGTSDLTDGVYLWPAGLAHYIDEHGVRLPEPIVTHFLAQAKAREAAAKAA